MMRDPIVSVPIDIGEKPAATATAEPEDEPPGFCGSNIRIVLRKA
jgi:hypothetical protein